MSGYWIRLAEVLGRGSAKIAAVLSKFGSPKAVFDASYTEICRSGIFSDKEIKIINKLPLDYQDKVIENCRNAGISIITPDSEKYPARLRNIQNPPCALYVKGSFPCFDDEVAVTVVGPRNATRTGVKAAASLAARLSVAGCVTVSGAARGIDRASLEGTLAAYGKAVCVVPCGLDSDYPADTLELRREILKSGGCIISECPPGTRYNKGAFHLRNRILSALSLATVVIEAGERSGALITAGCALTQGRDIFVMPGSVEDEAHVGSNRLLRDGARALLSADDILLEYARVFPHKLNLIEANKPFDEDILRRLTKIIGAKEKTASGDLSTQSSADDVKKTLAPKDTSGLSELARKTLDGFADIPVTPDRIADITGLSVGDILSALVELEIYGFVRALPGGRYELAD